MALTARVLKLRQQRDRHGLDRSKRFMVFRLRRFEGPWQEGHDVFWGTCLLVHWGNDKNIFAVVRVIGLMEDGKSVFSIKLDKGNPSQFLNVELMDPKRKKKSGAQAYKSSGYQLPRLGARMVLKIVALSLVDVDEGAGCHEALLSVADIDAVTTKGAFRRVTASEGYVHVQNVLEQIAEKTKGVLWNANKSEHACYSESDSRR